MNDHPRPIATTRSGLLALGALWATGALAIATFLWSERQEIEARERDHLVQQAGIVDENLGRQLEAMDRSLDVVLTDLRRWSDAPDRLERAGRRLTAFSDAMIGVRTMMLLDARGTVIAASRPELVGSEFSREAYFVAARRGESPETLYVSPPYETSLGVWAITLARIVPDSEGGFDGVVAVTLDPAAFRTLLQSVVHDPGGLAAIAHGDGLRFLIVPEHPESAGANLSRPDALFTRHGESAAETSILRGPIPGVAGEHLVAIRTIAPPELGMDKPLVVAVAREWSGIFSAWRGRAWGLGLAYAVLGAALILGLRSLGKRRLAFERESRELAARRAELEARWRVVLEATNQGVWDWNTVSNQVYHSKVWKTMLGFEEDEVGEDFDEWSSRIHPDDMPQAQAALEGHLRGDLDAYEAIYRLRAKDGSYRWMLDRGRVVERGPDGQPLRVVGCCTDVSEHRQQQETLDRLTANIPGALYQYQVHPDGHSSFPYASSGIQEIYGFRPEELAHDASPVFSRIHPEDLNRVNSGIQESSRRLEVWSTEYRVILPGRGERWLSGRARPQRLSDGSTRWHGYIHDVTEGKQQSLQLQETEGLLRQLMQEMPVGLAMIDQGGRAYFVNNHLKQLVGHSLQEVATLEEWWVKAYPDDEARKRARETWHTALARAKETGGYLPSQDYAIPAPDGSIRTIRVSGLLFANSLLATVVDETEARAEGEVLRRLAYVDGLTGLTNRRRFDEALQGEWNRCRRSQKPLSMLLIDIDHFKKYNDTYGHQQGDSCLQAVASVLQESFNRSHDAVARYGGEEFVCLMPECDVEGARAKAQALCQAVFARAIPHSSSSVADVVTVSIGVACTIPDGESSAQELLARADANLYAAKSKGRNRIDAG